MAKLKSCVIDKAGAKSTVTTPKFRPKLGRWAGGNSRTLYTFTDETTGRTVVRPGHNKLVLGSIGPEAKVRVATKAEAEEHWQDPLHEGWKTACDD